MTCVSLRLVTFALVHAGRPGPAHVMGHDDNLQGRSTAASIDLDAFSGAEPTQHHDLARLMGCDQHRPSPDAIGGVRRLAVQDRASSWFCDAITTNIFVNLVYGKSIGRTRWGNC